MTTHESPPDRLTIDDVDAMFDLLHSCGYGEPKQFPSQEMREFVRGMYHTAMIKRGMSATIAWLSVAMFMAELRNHGVELFWPTPGHIIGRMPRALVAAGRMADA